MKVCMSGGKALSLVKVLLTLSILVGLVILAFDGLLWFDNPLNGHATALTVFTAVQVFIMALLFVRPRFGANVLFYWSLLYLVILLLNPLTGPVIGLTVQDFALYLFGITPVTSTPQFSCPFLCPPFIISYDLLLIIQAITAAVLFQTRKRIT